MDPSSGDAKALVRFAATASQLSVSIDEYVADVKANRFCTTDWGAVLSAAPVCLELLASCHVVSSTDIAYRPPLIAPANGFQYLKGFAYLKPALAEIAGKGEECFNRTNIGMAKIELGSKHVQQTVSGAQFAI